MKRLAIVAVSLMTAFSATTPAHAFPVAAAPALQNSDVTQVDWHGHGGNRWRPRGVGGYHGGHYHGGYRHGGYYRGHHGNAGAIIGGLAAGAIIGGIVAGSRSHESHAQYCASHYRTYRASDNTYQPTNGPRVQCR